MDKMTLHVAMISEGQCRESSDTFVAHSHEQLIAKVADYCRLNWTSDESGGEPPEADADVVDRYFKDHYLVLVFGPVVPLPGPPCPDCEETMTTRPPLQTDAYGVVPVADCLDCKRRWVDTGDGWQPAAQNLQPRGFQ